MVKSNGFHVLSASLMLFCAVDEGRTQGNSAESFPAQQRSLPTATNSLPQSVGGSNRSPDRFDRTALDRASGKLRDTVGGSERGHDPPPATNRPEDLQHGANDRRMSSDNGLEFLGQPLHGGSGSSGGMSHYPAASMLHGAADTIRSIGEANRNSAAANVLQQKAQEQAIQNRYGSAMTYFQTRAANRQFHQGEAPAISSAQDRVRYSQSRLPRRLSDTELNRQIGDIRWPAVLLAPEFTENRDRLEGLFYSRTYFNSGLASSNYLEVKAETDRMLAMLHGFAEMTEPQSYVHARKFIEALSYEARFVAGA